MVLYINYVYNIHVVTAYMYDQQKIEEKKNTANIEQKTKSRWHSFTVTFVQYCMSQCQRKLGTNHCDSN